jgi:hypothetical protein
LAQLKIWMWTTFRRHCEPFFSGCGGNRFL